MTRPTQDEGRLAGISRRGLVGGIAGLGIGLGGAALATAEARRRVNGMLRIRKSDERGHARHGWLDSRHTFSFADYYDPEHMGFGALRVINEDRVIGGAGFPTHPHRDMEILSYVLDGGLEHKDSMGTGSVIRPGDVQRMSAGTGVLHSEYNASKKDPVHFLQIWIVPEARGIEPSYEQRHFAPEEKRNRFRLLASRTGEDGSVVVHQDVRLYGSLLQGGVELDHALAPGRKAWLHVARGDVTVGESHLAAGDAVAVTGLPSLRVRGESDAEVLLFDLA